MKMSKLIFFNLKSEVALPDLCWPIDYRRTFRPQFYSSRLEVYLHSSLEFQVKINFETNLDCGLF